jgi:tetratricopeptide (TPR) repeat protein
MIRRSAWLLLAGLTFLILNPGEGETPALEKSFWQADFASVTAHFEKQDEKTLSLKDRLLWVECLARTGRSDLAGEKLQGFSAGLLPSSSILAAEGSVYLAQGRQVQAERAVAEALALESVSEKAVLARVLLSLFSRDFAGAERWYGRLLGMIPEFRESFLVYLIGLEVYSARRDSQTLRRLYEKRASQWKDRDKKYADSLKANARLYQKALKMPLFSAAGPLAESVIPFARSPEDSLSNIILYEAEGLRYRVLLDTGNRAGWTIHSPELLRQLKCQRGGRIFSEIGTQPGLMEGSSIFTKKLEYEGLSLTGLPGLYVPKPQPEFFDANLNPSFIRNRVVTLDYVARQLRLSLPGISRPDLARTAAEGTGKISWFGYRHVYVPVKVGGVDGLALIETGAKDISLRLEFARRLGWPLAARTRYLASGETVSYHVTPLRVTLGPFIFERDAAEVWPFQQLMDPLSGLIPDVVIGPEALAGSFILTFDPFEDLVLLEKRESPDLSGST